MTNRILLLALALCFFSCAPNPAKPADTETKAEPVVAKPPTPKVISDPTNTLTGKEETLELEYIVWGSACANWISPADRKKYENQGLKTHCIFIEPADSSMTLPAHFQPETHLIKVKGQFYAKPDYPKGTVQAEEPMEPAKVFEYTELHVVRNK